MAYVLISGRDFNESRKKIRESKSSGREVVFASDDDELARKVLEKEAINVLLINQEGRKDGIKQRNSGFNQVLAKTAKKKNVTLGINIEEIFKAEKEDKAEMLARVRQNVRLCNKNKLKMRFISKTDQEKDKHDLKCLGLVLGMPTWMTKNL